ncbi:MAG: biotin transporter BioY [Candidatus Omnitrophica bacterium]|nr:biotin transporter BioY [Candidatus Omnitrophota bacterium]MCM8830182.1 biotin transporter BioY [Candidatus Omnitrophota bacterium]
MEKILDRWDGFWRRYYEISISLTGVEKVAVSLLFAVLTGLSAQFYILLPFTPVPVTGQVFVVLLCGILLGKSMGTLSQILYLTGGVAGINWFYGASCGILRPTTGYITGFVLATYLVGFIAEKKRTKLQMVSGMLSGIGIIHLCGIIWLTFFLKVSIYKAFVIGSLPFIPFDIVKAYFAGLLGSSMLKSKK